MGAKVLERDDELRVLAEAARAAAAGRGSVLLVSGEAGIGKSSLVAAARGQLPPEGRLLVGHCDDLATARPLGPFHDLPGAALPLGEDREALLRALWDELDRPGRPTVLAVEDVHWADHATLDVLRHLVRRVEQLPVVLVLTYRDDELARDAPLRSLLGLAAATPGTRRLPLGRLSPVAVERLCAAADVAPAGVYALTAGNPYYVSEVLAAGAVDAVPLSVVDAVLARARGLDAGARDAVEQLSVVPGTAERALVDALLPEGLASVVAAEERGLLAVRSGGVGFRHELTRRAVADALPGSRRAVLEGRVLAALQAGPDPQPARLVHHAAAAGDVEAVVRYAPQAAREAVRSGAHREAAAHFALALEHAGAYGDAERADLLEGSAQAVYAAGGSRDAVADAAGAVRLRRGLGDPVALGAALRWLSRICWWYGQRAQAQEAADEAVAVLEATGDPRLLAMAYSNCAQLDMLADRTDRAVELGGQAAALARAGGDAGTLSHALCNVGTARWLRGDPGALEVLGEALAVARAAGESEHAVRASVNTVWCLLESLQPAAAARLLPAALELAEDGEHLVFRDYLLVERAMTELAAGCFDEARASAQAGLDSPGPVRCAALVVVNRVAVRTGQPERRLLTEMWQLAEELAELQRTGPAAAVLAEAAWLAGGDEALRRGEVADVLARTHAEAVRRRRAPLVAELGHWLRRAGAPVHLRPEHPYGLLAAGRPRAAARAWRAAGHPYEAAASLAESPRPEDGLQALAELDALGAVPLASRVRRELRSRGVAGVPRGPLPTTRAAGGLTRRQSEVLALVRDGLTNAQIAQRLVISERTADHHVAAVLAKLGVHHRAEAAEMGTRRP